MPDSGDVVADHHLLFNRHLLAAIHRNISDGIYRAAPGGEIVYANEAMARLFGYDGPEAMQGIKAAVLYPHPALYRRVVRRMRMQDGLRSQEVEFARYDGSRFWGMLSCTIVRDEAGDVAAYDGIVTDITERLRAEQALRESEERWRRLVEHHPEPIMITIDTRIVYLNEAGTRILGASAPDVLYGRSILDFVRTEPMDDQVEQVEIVARKAATSLREFVIVGCDGAIRYVASSSVPITYEGRSAAQTVMRDVTQRHLYEQQLIKAREQALELARIKSIFLANMSHEIRTPLTAIIGFADILDEQGSEENREFARLIRHSGERLMQTLNSVLDLAHIEGGTLTLAPVDLDVVAVVRQVLDMFQGQARQNHLYLRLDVPGETVPACLDAGALSRILTNLVSNALKFTPEGGVTVMVEPGEQTLVLCVKDTGIGISEEFLPHLFEAFYQESAGLTRGYGGSGLGLTITRHLVEMMKGTIDVESRKDEGSTFVVRLPCSIARRASEAPAPASHRTAGHPSGSLPHRQPGRGAESVA